MTFSDLKRETERIFEERERVAAALAGARAEISSQTIALRSEIDELQVMMPSGVWKSFSYIILAGRAWTK